MPKMRVHELAKLLDKSSKEIIAELKQQGVEVQSHMSTVSDEHVDKLKAKFQKKESGNNRGNNESRSNDNRGSRNDNRGDRNNNRNDNRGDGRNNNRNNDNRNGRNENRGDGRNNNRNDNRGGRNNRNDNRNDNRGGGRNNNRNNDNRGGRNDNRGDNRNNNRNGNDRRNRPSMGDTPINAKETRNGKENRHDINREHSRDNKENNRNDNRGGKNNRRNNRNNDFGSSRKQKNNKKQQAPVQPPKQEEPKEDVIRNITLPDPVSLKDLADACKVQPSVIIKKLFMAGQMVTINTEFSFDDAAEIALEYNCIAEEEVKVDVIEELLKEEEEDERNLTSRPPVVCVMGHVDHGKTSLLDAIRSTHVTAGEAGGITQHIGAYVVEINGEKITFLDTPGHEAFTSMRLRGAQATDIAVLVVAADDGVMPQTIEAINHAKAAEVEVIVAVNKIDKEGANVDRVKQELTEYGLIAEDWGGSTVFVPVSAKTGEGIDELLEMITLTAEVLELKANAKRRARGLVIEAKLDKGRGPVATILIQKGTLHVGDSINVGHAFGRVRAMMDDKGNRVKVAGPSTPVEILGLNDVPFSGEVLMAHGNEKEARATADAFIAYGREKMLEETKNKLSLDDLFDQIQAGNVKELNLVVKADVQGSVEAVKQSLMKLSNEEVMIKVVHGGANVDRVKQELTEYGLIAEDWGGSTVFVPVSAKTGEGIDELLEMITLTAEVLELKANAKRRARGLVIEAKLDKGRGPVATILIQKGTLHVGDSINVGHAFGRVRAMMDDKGNRVKVAGPSTPVEILGLNDVPFSGEVLMAHGNEKEARATADAFIAYGREKMLEETKNKLSLDDLFDQIQAGNVKELNLVVKADVQGSVEAVKQSLMKLSNEEVMIKVVHGGVGAINESDVILASASNAIIIGFNVRPDAMAKAAAEREKVDMRLYRVIYNAIEDIEAAIKGMLDPVYREKVIGHVEVRQIYKASGVGTIAGCYVLDGTITKDAQSRIVRDGIVIYEGELASLKRFKDDVKEVKAGFECGIVFEKYNDIKEGDQIEAFVMEEIPR
mgnify:CR=1 FL=1